MKLSKKVFTTALLFAVCVAALSAQGFRLTPKSMTAESTLELFGTDVDDYLNVNEWDAVKPEKLFGFLSYGSKGNGALNAGFAVPIGKFYLGGFFGGELTGWSFIRDTNKDNKVTTTSSATVMSTPSTNIASGSMLFGFNNIGVMGNFSFRPKSGNEIKKDAANEQNTTTSKFDLDAALRAGINITGPKDMVFKTAAEVGIVSNVNKEKIEKTGSSKSTKITIQADHLHTLIVKGSVGFDFAHNGPVTQSADFALDTAWAIYPKTIKDDNTSGTRVTTKQYGQMNDSITLTPAWQIAYEPEESKVAFKAKVGIPMTLSFTKDKDYEEDSSTGKRYNTTRNHTNSIGFNPTLQAGLIYAPVSKFHLNLGFGFTVPTFNLTISKTENRKTDGSASSLGTTKKNTWTFATATGKITMSSGFTWLITQNVTIDAYWEVAQNLLDGFGTQNKLIPGNTKNFWETVNGLLIHHMGFLVAVKL